MDTFKKRLENRPIKENLNLVDMKADKEELCKMRLNNAKENKTKPWEMTDLEVVLKHLKKNKSRDPLGYANELFRPETAGDDLKLAILMMMNRIKQEQISYCTGAL